MVTMQKDEGDLLKTWVEYHAKLFGYRGIHIVDNGSTDPTTLAHLGWAEGEGAKVYVRPKPTDFERKGIIVSEILNEHCAGYDVCFPLDSDEYVAGYEGRKPTSADAVIERELRAFLDSGKPLMRLRTCLWNVPGTTSGYFSPHYKVGTRPEYKVTLDLGLHLFDHAKGKDTVDPDLLHRPGLGLMHFHNRSFEEVRRRARAKLRYRLKDFEPETLKAYRGAGGHLIKYFQMEEADYYRQFDKLEADMGDAFGRFGLAVPFSDCERPAA